MARQNNFKQDNKQRFGMMEKRGISIFIIGALLFIISLRLDSGIAAAFKNAESRIFDPLFSVVTNFGVAMVFLLWIPCIILYNKNKKVVKLLLLSFLVSFALSFLLKLMFLKQRPIGLFEYPFTNIISYSFPSMHAMVMFSLLPIIKKYLPQKRHFFAWFAYLVAFTRIYFGFHFLSDVVFGAFFGYFIGAYLTDLHERGILWKKV